MHQRDNRLLYLTLVIFATFCTLQAFFGAYFWDPDSFTIGNDDAFITYRYGVNLVDHGIISFNPTDTPPVEGFSNPLFVLLSAAAYVLFGLDGVYPAMAVLGAFFTAFALVVIYRYAVTAHDTRIAGFTVLCLGFFPSLWINATSGLETSAVFLAQVWVWLSFMCYLEDR